MRTTFRFAMIAAMLIAAAGGVRAYAAPVISFAEPPTPANGATIYDTSAEIKVSITETALADVTFNWNGTDHGLYGDSLVLMFNFDNVAALGEDYGSGSAVKDLSGSGNDGILSDPPGIPAWTSDGRYGGAFEFTGDGATSGQSILVPHSESLNPGSGDFAIVVWVRTKHDVDGDILRKGSTDTTDPDAWYKLEHSPSANNDKIGLNFNTDGTDATFASVAAYNDEQWHFVVAQRRGSQAELWIDGALDGTASVSGSISNTADLTVGSKDTQNDDFLNSTVDEVRLYMRSFSDDEIKELYYSNLSKYATDSWTLYVNQSNLADETTYTYQASASDDTETSSTEIRSLTVNLVGPPSVTLEAPSDGSIVNHTDVTFKCSATDEVGLQDATLYVGGSPETVTFSGTADMADAQISADFPDENYGDDTDISINVDGLNPHSHAVIKVPNLIGTGEGQVPPESAIVCATLEVNCSNSGEMMQLYRLTEDWVESEVTWNNASASVPWTDAGADGPSSNAGVAIDGDCTATGWRTLDVTQFVQEWSDGVANYGIVITDTGGTDGVDFDSSESANPPVLTVTYGQSDWQPIETKLMSGTSDTVTFAPVPLNNQEDYVWNCLVTSISGLQSWAPADFQLTVDTAYPDEPVLVQPADGATGVALSPTLEVTVSNPQGQPMDVTFYGRGAGSGADEFTIVALPDTQNYCEFPENAYIFTEQTQWIKDNIATRNIVFVTHEGDIVEHPGSTTEYDRARDSMSVLDPGLVDLSDPMLPDPYVPYGVGPGNHDQPTGPPPSGYYNEYFPYTHYENRGLAWYGGHYPSTGNDNNYQLFSAGGMDFIIVHLEYNPGSDVITWADGVLTAYADRMAIITTHAYIDTSANLLSEGNGIWNTLVQGNDNVYFVLCGHKHGEAKRTDVVNGREVHQILADYQERTNGGNGWLRIMRFVPAEDKVYVETYSPHLLAYEADADSQFTLDLPMDWVTEIGTNTGVPSGTNTSVVWSDLLPGTNYEWFVEVTDAGEHTQTGPMWTFTTQGNDPPVAVDDGYGVDEDNTLTVDAASGVLVNDSDPENDPLTAILVSDVSDGTLSLNADGSFTYTPDADFYGQDSFTYKANDGSLDSDPATVTITVNPVNDAPVATDDSYGTEEDTPLSVPAPGVLDNDTDAENGPLTAALVSGPSNGLVVLNADGSFLYTPNGSFVGEDSFTYVANDGTADSDPATVAITVNPPNNAPVAINDSATTDMDTAVIIDVLFNDIDADGDPLIVTNLSDPPHGTATINANETVTYTPDPGYIGGDAFTYTANDGVADSAPATVTVTVNPPGPVDDAANSDIAVEGAVTGDYTDTWVSDNSYEAIEEAILGGGKPKNLRSSLEHKWTVDVVGGDTVTFYVEAYRTDSGEGDEFVFAYSTDDSSYTDMLTVTKTADDGACQTYSLPGTVSGTVYIRVQDTDATRGNGVPDTIYVDHIFIRSSMIVAPPEMASNPSPADEATNVPVETDLSWTAGAGAESHDVYFGTSDPPTFIGNQTATTFDPGTLATNTTYYWRIDELNAYGTTTGVVWSFTTKVNGVTEVYVNDITMGYKQAGKNYFGLATVWIKDDTGLDVEGATVYGEWSGAVSGAASGVTGPDGKVTLQSAKNSGGTFTFTVTNVEASGCTYNPALNVETSDSITAP